MGLSYWLGTYLSANIHKMIFLSIGKGKYKEREGKGWELTLYLRINILWSMGNPMPELTLTHSIAGLHSSKRTKNLGSGLQEPASTRSSWLLVQSLKKEVELLKRQVPFS